MKGNFLLSAHGASAEPDIFADKSALVLEWLLMEGFGKGAFSLREVALETQVSLGLVQRIFETLVREGHLSTVGVRTAKRFKLSRPERLLQSWLDHYSIVKKCKMWTYRTALVDLDEARRVVGGPQLRNGVALALHSSADEQGVKNTNLATLELYLLEEKARPGLERKLKLDPQERGYEVLLIKPYYKGMLSKSAGKQGARLQCSPPLLTFLDLYHFPLRGREQAEFMANRIPELKRIYKRG